MITNRDPMPAQSARAHSQPLNPPRRKISTYHPNHNRNLPQTDKTTTKLNKTIHPKRPIPHKTLGFRPIQPATKNFRRQPIHPPHFPSPPLAGGDAVGRGGVSPNHNRNSPQTDKTTTKLNKTIHPKHPIPHKTLGFRRIRPAARNFRRQPIHPPFPSPPLAGGDAVGRGGSAQTTTETCLRPTKTTTKLNKTIHPNTRSPAKHWVSARSDPPQKIFRRKPIHPPFPSPPLAGGDAVGRGGVSPNHNQNSPQADKTITKLSKTIHPPHFPSPPLAGGDAVGRGGGLPKPQTRRPFSQT